MRIDSASIGMDSARSYHASKTSVRRFEITDYQAGLTDVSTKGQKTPNGEDTTQNTEEQENTAENTTMRVVCWYLLPDGICEAVPVNRHCLPSGNIRCVIFLIYYSRPGTALCGTGCRKTDGAAVIRPETAGIQGIA